MAALLCGLLGHQIDRRKVWFDDLDFRTSCRRCGFPLIRDPDGWRGFDCARDMPAGGPRRKAHPRHRE